MKSRFVKVGPAKAFLRQIAGGKIYVKQSAIDAANALVERHLRGCIRAQGSITDKRQPVLF